MWLEEKHFIWIIIESEAAKNGKYFYHENKLLALFIPPGAISIAKWFILPVIVFMT